MPDLYFTGNTVLESNRHSTISDRRPQRYNGLHHFRNPVGNHILSVKMYFKDKMHYNISNKIFPVSRKLAPQVESFHLVD